MAIVSIRLWRLKWIFSRMATAHRANVDKSLADRKLVAPSAEEAAGRHFHSTKNVDADCQNELVILAENFEGYLWQLLKIMAVCLTIGPVLPIVKEY